MRYIYRMLLEKAIKDFGTLKAGLEYAKAHEQARKAKQQH